MAYVMGNARRVVLGISGGVDSAVSALLLKKKGYEVIGLFMRNWDHKEETGQCNQDQEAETAEWVCKKVGIPFKEVSFVEEYWNSVFLKMIDELQEGLTPVPDIHCNQYIKFDKFLEHAKDKYSTPYIATGHYARTSFGEDLQHFDENKRVKLLQAYDKERDQTFFLSQISEKSLRSTLFPLGDLIKDIVRKIADSEDLTPVANKQSSKGICFIGERNFSKFISQYIDDRPGEFIDLDNNEVIGKHNGFHHYTIGQCIRVGGQVFKYFVQSKDIGKGNIYVVAERNHPALYTSTVFTEPLHWINLPHKEFYNKGQLECGYRSQQVQTIVDCILKVTATNTWNLSPIENGMTVSLAKLHRAVTPGQYAVFYKGDECLGSGKIIRTGPTPYIMNEKMCRDKIKSLRLDYENIKSELKSNRKSLSKAQDREFKEKLKLIYNSVLT